LDTPDDREVRYTRVVADGYIIDQMNDFRNLPDDTLESDIQMELVGLVNAVARSFRVRIRPNGILARDQYDLCSKFLTPVD
jgi:hypothetical protein